jgi:hypothetical protein
MSEFIPNQSPRRYDNDAGAETDREAPPAGPVRSGASVAVIAPLGPDWRLIDDPIQWIVQRRVRQSNEKSTGWQARSHFTSKDALLLEIQRLGVLLSPETLNTLNALPSIHAGYADGVAKARERYRREEQAELAALKAKGRARR